MPKTFVGKLFARNEAFRGTERQCADRAMKTGYPLEVGFKADLTSKVQLGMEFGRFPVFIGNGRTSEMDSESFGVVSKTFAGNLFVRSEAFREMQGNVLIGL